MNYEEKLDGLENQIKSTEKHLDKLNQIYEMSISKLDSVTQAQRDEYFKIKENVLKNTANF